MENHSHRSNHTLAHEGGDHVPNPGRTPRGASSTAATPAWSNMPSDWYDENVWSAATQVRKSTVHTAAITRGHRLIVSNAAATNPAPTTTRSAPSAADHQ